MLCNMGLALHRSSKGEVMDEAQPLPAGSWSHYGVYEADDGGNKGDRSEVLKGGPKDCFLFDSWFASKRRKKMQ